MPNPPNKLKKPSSDELRILYVDEQRTYRQIMNHFKMNSARTLARWLQQSGIPIRHGGEAVKVQWKNAEARRVAASKKAKESFSPHWGKPVSEETREKIRQSKIGSRNPMWGKNAEEHHLFLGGKDNWRFGRRISNKKKAEIRNKFGNACQACGSHSRLEIHHDPPYRICQSHKMKFLKLLCQTCHKEADRALLLEYPKELTIGLQPKRRSPKKDAPA